MVQKVYQATSSFKPKSRTTSSKRFCHTGQVKTASQLAHLLHHHHHVDVRFAVWRGWESKSPGWSRPTVSPPPFSCLLSHSSSLSCSWLFQTRPVHCPAAPHSLHSCRASPSPASNSPLPQPQSPRGFSSLHFCSSCGSFHLSSSSPLPRTLPTHLLSPRLDPYVLLASFASSFSPLCQSPPL